MVSSKVSADELAPPEPSSGAPAAPASPKTEGGGKKEKASKVKKEKAPKVKKEKAPKVKKEKAPKVKKEKAPKGPTLPKGTTVRYLGGSRAKKLKKGDTGTIMSHFGGGRRYGVKFESGTTVLATKFVEKG